MLNIKKFQNHFKVTIQGGIKMVHDWNDDGEEDYISTLSMEYFNGSFVVDVDHINLIGKKIIEFVNSRNYSCYEEKDFVIIDNRVVWNQIEDAECNIIYTETKYSTKEYLCDYEIFVSINGVLLEEEDLIELLPQAF